jgi:hypothetical protein
VRAVWAVHNALGTRELHAIEAEVRHGVVGMCAAADVRGARQLCGRARVPTHHVVCAWVEARIAVGAEASAAVLAVYVDSQRL